MKNKSRIISIITCIFFLSCVSYDPVHINSEIKDLNIESPSLLKGYPIEVVYPSLAYTSGLKTKDYIIAINGKSYTEVSDFYNSLSSNTSVNITVLRGNKELSFTIDRNPDERYGIKIFDTTEVKGDGEPIELNVSHPKYEDFSLYIETSDEYSENFMTPLSATAFLAFLGGSLTATGLFAMGEETIALPTLLVSLGALGYFFYDIKNNPTPLYPPAYIITKRDINKYLLIDDEGYNIKTGFNKYNVNRYGLYKNGNHFSGIIINGIKTGFGVFKVSNPNLIYIGNFVNDKIDGIGIERETNKSTTFIRFKNGLKNGYGVKKSESLLELELWDNGLFISKTDYSSKIQSKYNLVYLGKGSGLVNGNGDAISLDGEVIVKNATFNNGKITSGEYYLPSGKILSGVFENDSLINGTIFYPNGMTYKGELVNSIPQGYGSMTYRDGSIYTGQFRNGLYNGDGKYVDYIGNIYEGNFSDGVFNGIGIYTFFDGGYYKGNFTKGTYNGKGVLVMANGETFDGNFLNGLPHGTGIYKFNDKIQRAEYYEGIRIDQAYQLEKTLEAFKEEELKKIELAKRKQEEARIAAEKKQREAEERRAKEEASRKNKRLWGNIFAGVAGYGMGQAMGGDVSQSMELANELLKISNGDTSTLEGMLSDDINNFYTPKISGTRTGDESVFVEKKLETTNDSLVYPVINENESTDTRTIITKTFISDAISITRFPTEYEAIKNAKSSIMSDLQMKAYSYGLVDSVFLREQDVTFKIISVEYKEKNRFYPAGFKATVAAEWTGRLYERGEPQKVMLDE